MKSVFILVFLILANNIAIASDRPEVVLTDSLLGDFEISVGKQISLHKLSKAFPNHRVTHEIGSGDSPDYHIFTLATYTGERVASLISYIKEDKMCELALVPLDEVVLYGGGGIDQYGISPGDSLLSALEKRKNMEYGYGHMDNYIGADNTWYVFYALTENQMRATKEQAIKINPIIEIISWPKPRWR